LVGESISGKIALEALKANQYKHNREESGVQSYGLDFISEQAGKESDVQVKKKKKKKKKKTGVGRRLRPFVMGGAVHDRNENLTGLRAVV